MNIERLRHRAIPTLIGLLAVNTAVTAQSVLYVDDDAPALGDGLSWSTAYRFPQDALAAASGKTVIRVAVGIYTPDRDELNPDGPGNCFEPHGGLGCTNAGCEAAVCAALPFCCGLAWDDVCTEAALDLCGAFREATFQLLNGVTLQGGYAGLGAPDPDERDPAVHESVLSGDLTGNDGPGLFENNHENSLHVVTGSATDSTAVLDGFTITAGHANGPVWPQLGSVGAGMLNNAGSPTVTDCHITGNLAEEYGGGMENLFGSSPTVSNSVISSNAATFTGAGIDCFADSGPVITACVFTDNVILDQNPGALGAGMYIGGGVNNTVVTGCVFVGNTARSGGGLMTEQASPTITDCQFTGNTSSFGGGIGNVINSSPTITGCTFTDNISVLDPGGFGGYGAAILNWEDCSPLITGCHFEGNTATRLGGAVYSRISSNPTLTNCIFKANSADLGGGAIGAAGLPNGVTTLNNCILWGNTSPQGPEIALHGEAPAEITVSYSDVQGGAAGVFVPAGHTLTWGDGNIDVDPLFVDPDNGDYRLGPGSPCIDAASNPAVPVGITTDLDGNPRFTDDPCTVVDTGLGDPPVVDMGAYEFQNTSCDLNGDGVVGINDFLALLAAWGPCADCENCPADFNGACSVGITDFLLLLAWWG